VLIGLSMKFIVRLRPQNYPFATSIVG
jgi:hypothetical protein